MGAQEHEIQITKGSLCLPGILGLPSQIKGVVLFAHGTGSGRLSPRNQFVAHQLQEAGFATLLIDLLEEKESQDREKVFDIALLADRLYCGIQWLHQESATQDFPLGLFGASTGAGAAIQVAAQFPEAIQAVVCRGGRPDLAKPYLSKVKAPTLLIVGGRDDPVIKLNQEALSCLSCPRELMIVPGASHLFEEKGKLESVAILASQWFQRHLRRVAPT